MFHAPNLRHLAALVEINRFGSINKAAEAVHVSQSALTQGLSKIESEIGAELFDRSTTGMYANEAGQAFLERIARALHCFQSFDKDLNSRQTDGASHKPNHPIRDLHLRTSNAQLRAVIAVVEHKNISLAANSLALAQPTVQRAVRDVEKICGETLFIRSANGVDPSYLARRLARFASLGLAEIQAGIEDIHEIQGKMTGLLSIGALPLARTELVPSTVTQLLERYPLLKVSIIDGPYEELVHALAHGRIHLIIGALRQNPPMRELVQTALFDDQLSAIVRSDHPKLQSKKLSLNDIAKLDWIAPRVGTPARQRFRDIFLQKQLQEPNRIIECSSTVAIRGLLLKSDRVALLPKRQILPEIEAGLLGTLPLNLRESSRTIGLTTRHGWKPTQAQKAYIDLVQAKGSEYKNS